MHQSVVQGFFPSTKRISMNNFLDLIGEEECLVELSNAEKVT